MANFDDLQREYDNRCDCCDDYHEHEDEDDYPYIDDDEWDEWLNNNGFC